MKLSKKSLYKKFKKYETGGPVTPALPKSGPELTYPADVTYGEENLTGEFPTGQPLNEYVPIQFPDLRTKQLTATQFKPFTLDNLSGPKAEEVVITPSEQGKQDTNKDKDSFLDPSSLFTLGLAGISTGLNYNADLQNKRRLNESIQQRQSDPLYDYNYMYGRTSMGGTQYQPIIKAEMGAKIQNRYNTPNSLNNVEIEGGEYLQLPDMSTEMAYGPSHSNGGIQTSLPDGTRVYSDTLKPMGSKKTFAQMAKKYDNTEYDKILDNKFSKQVDKDTAMLMKQKNQKMLDKLFMDQQILNGNSNGEVMAKNGASINNPGFKALPPAVQQKIISNMEYGGFSLPNPLYMQNGAQTDWYNSDQWDSAMIQNSPQNPMNPGMAVKPDARRYFGELPLQNPTAQGLSATTAAQIATGQKFMQPNELPWNQSVETTQGIYNPFANSLSPQSTTQVSQNILASRTSVPNQPSQPNQSVQTKQATAPKAPAQSKSIQTNQNNQSDKAIPTYTQEEVDLIRQYDPNFNPVLATVPGMQKTVEGVYGSKKNIDIFKENYDWYLPKFKEQYGRDFDPTSKKDVGMAQKAYQEEMLNRFISAGYTPEEAQQVLQDVGFVDKQGVPNAFDEKLGFYTATRKLFNPKSKDPNTVSSKPDFGRELPPSKKGDKAKTAEFNAATETQQGQYTKQGFPLIQAIPNIMGLAGAQDIFSYGIPEVDAPYLRPQEMQIQSELQNIDNMGQAAIRSGADPLAVYIQGTTAKDQVYQRKQNADAQLAAQTDIRNTMMEQQANAMNAQMFDRTYNNLIAQARDAQSAEKQAAVSNLIKKKAMHDQSENIKQAYINNLTNAFNVGADGVSSFDVANKTSPIVNSGYMTADDANIVTNEVRKNLAERAKATQPSTKKTSKKK